MGCAISNRLPQVSEIPEMRFRILPSLSFSAHPHQRGRAYPADNHYRRDIQLLHSPTHYSLGGDFSVLKRATVILPYPLLHLSTFSIFISSSSFSRNYSRLGTGCVVKNIIKLLFISLILHYMSDCRLCQ